MKTIKEINLEYWVITLPGKIWIKKSLVYSLLKVLIVCGLFLCGRWSTVYSPVHTSVHTSVHTPVHTPESEQVRVDSDGRTHFYCSDCKKELSLCDLISLSVSDYRDKGNLHSNNYTFCDDCYYSIFPENSKPGKRPDKMGINLEDVETLNLTQRRLLDFCNFSTNSPTREKQNLIGPIRWGGGREDTLCSICMKIRCGDGWFLEADDNTPSGYGLNILICRGCFNRHFKHLQEKQKPNPNPNNDGYNDMTFDYNLLSVEEKKLMLKHDGRYLE